MENKRAGVEKMEGAFPNNIYPLIVVFGLV
jgi:hypothetical protein